MKDRDLPSCCNDSNNLFEFQIGYLQAVINGDGTNRLGPYIPTDGTATAAPTSTASTGFETSSSSKTSAIAPTAVTAGDTGGLSTPARDAAIAIGVALGTTLLITITVLVYVWRKLSRERRLRREGQKSLTRQDTGTRPQLTHQIAFQTGESGVAGGTSETYAEEPDAPAQELPVVPRVGELST